MINISLKMGKFVVDCHTRDMSIYRLVTGKGLMPASSFRMSDGITSSARVILLPEDGSPTAKDIL